jgi:hypothetical protein
MSTNSDVRFSLPLDAQHGPASRISRARAATIVRAAMNLEGESRVDVRRPPPRRRLWTRVPFLAAAALVVPVTVIAGAVRYVAVHRAATSALMISTQAPSPGVVPTHTSSPASEGKTMDPLAGQLVESAPVDPVVSAPVDPIELGLAATVGDARVAEAPRVRAGATVRRSPIPEATPQDMLQQANDLRARHQWLAATQTYERTSRTFPGRAEAYSAMVAAGMLHLDQLGDAKGALSLFTSAIQARPQGPLSEEARWGVVRGHRALVDSRSELAALQEFVTFYPHSLLASRAQARLRELRGETTTQ